jgi:hypothetical protein
LNGAIINLLSSILRLLRLLRILAARRFRPVRCHRSLQNQPAGVESKPATPRCLIHIGFLDVGKDFSVS